MQHGVKDVKGGIEMLWTFVFQNIKEMVNLNCIISREMLWIGMDCSIFYSAHDESDLNFTLFKVIIALQKAVNCPLLSCFVLLFLEKKIKYYGREK